ncbi:MAG: hypothetical protein U0176_11945 [Bacteroidia bacterium]
MGFVSCVAHGDSVGLMASRRIGDLIRKGSGRIKKCDLHYVRIVDSESPADYTYWIEKEELRELGLEMKDSYDFETEGDRMIGFCVPVCEGCFEAIFDG